MTDKTTTTTTRCVTTTESNSDNEEDFDYYREDDFGGEFCEGGSNIVDKDPERLDFSCLDTGQVEGLLNECVAAVVEADSTRRLGPALAKMLLHSHNWNVPLVVQLLKDDREHLLITSHVKAGKREGEKNGCSVCANDALCLSEQLESLRCGHAFCRQCWQRHCELQIGRGVVTQLQCMQAGCDILAPEDFVLRILSDQAQLRAKYQNFVFRDHVNSHPQLRFCPGIDCHTVIRAKLVKAKRAICSTCSTSFCFRCGLPYHAPTSCEIIKKWLTKCADDSETANYISAHTKDCPQCHACIEKNGGCNHMQCAKCKAHFCWMCFGDWKTHGSEYYECSRYKENPSVAQEANHMKARRALEKYLHYYERFENHSKSLKLEEELRRRIKAKIETKVNRHEGTWIDWQYLHDAATLLTKCRYTLQYTYPYAYYMESGPRKQLFEFQQGQLEKEIEELSWKTERAETTDRGDMLSQMMVAEKKRLTLLHDFFD